MMYGISGTAIPAHLRYAQPIQAGCQKYPTFPPCLAYAIAYRETIGGEINGLWVSAASVVSGDGGHGLFQLTSSYPSDWENVDANVSYALERFLVPAMAYFAERGMRGDGLVRCIAAGFNSGDETTWEDHLRGNVDLGTTNDYAEAVLTNFNRLISGEEPV